MGSISGITGMGVSGTLNPDLFRFTGGTNSYPNPMYRYIHTFIPGNLMELFAWCEFIYNNSPQLSTSIRRFAEYPITEVVFPIENKTTKKYEDYFYHINLKDLLISCGIDYHVYGNAFISPYYPFIRFLKCQKCGKEFNAEKVDYKFSNAKFILNCPDCNHIGTSEARDRKIKNPKKLRWVRWSPKDVEIEFNEISNEHRYHLKMPYDIENSIKKGNLHMINSTPIEYIKAIVNNKRFCFSSDSIYHIKATTPAGFVKGWGFPMLTPALYEVLHVAVLKRANEAIAWEHIVPRMVISPAPSGSGVDPLKHVTMSKWKHELSKSKQRWNHDPNYIMYAPFPINVQQLGGNGRALMVSAEIEAAEKSLAMALGILLEFAAGTLAWQTSAMSLRLLKNQMYTMVSKLERFIQWVVDTTAKFIGWPSFKVALEPFELSDDDTRKQLLLQLNSQQKVSDDTLFKALGLDFEEEIEKIKLEQIKMQRMQMELQKELMEEQASITSQAQRAETMDQVAQQGPAMEDVDSLYEKSKQLAQMLVSETAPKRAAVLQQLEMENPPLHAMVRENVKKIMEAMRGQEAQAALEGAGQVAQSQPLGGTGGAALPSAPPATSQQG